MKKRIFIIGLAIVMIVAAICMLSACNFDNIEVDETSDESSTDFEGTKMICDDFVENTLSSSNFVANVTYDGSSYVAKIDGNKKMIESADEIDYYFVNEGHYYKATDDGSDKCYFEISKDEFDNPDAFDNAWFAAPYIYVADWENATFDCRMHEEGKATTEGFKGNGTLSLTVSVGNNSLTFNATSKDALLASATYRLVQDGDTVSGSVTLTYGNASVTIPDLSDFERIDE